MKIKNRYLTTLLFGLFFIACFTTCKKYPENSLWFKNPKRLAFMEGHLTHYIVNGFDSISYLDNYFYPDIFNNPYTHAFSDLEVHSYNGSKGHFEVSFDSPADYASVSNVIQSIKYSYDKGGKHIQLSGTNSILQTYKKNIFISDDIKWTILYLSKKDSKRKMMCLHNGIQYELQFN